MKFIQISSPVVALLGAIASALPQEDAEIEDPVPVSCPFNGTIGPNVMVATAMTPDGTSEQDAWIYGRNWCSNSNKISSGTNICSEDVDRTIEFLHIPMSDKFGKFSDECYANVDIKFFGCVYDATTNHTDYSNVVAEFTSHDGLSQQTYQCVDDRERRACVYNGELSPASEVNFTAYMSCGIMAEP